MPDEHEWRLSGHSILVASHQVCFFHRKGAKTQRLNICVLLIIVIAPLRLRGEKSRTKTFNLIEQNKLNLTLDATLFLVSISKNIQYVIH